MSQDITVTILPAAQLISSVVICDQNPACPTPNTISMPIIPEPMLRIGFMDPEKAYSNLQVYYNTTMDNSSFLSYNPVLCLFRLKKRRRKQYWDEKFNEFRVKKVSGKWSHPVMNENPVLGPYEGPHGLQNKGKASRDLITEWPVPNWLTPQTALPDFNFNPLPFYTCEGKELSYSFFPISAPGSGSLSSTANRKTGGVNAFFIFRFAITMQDNTVVFGPPSHVLRTFPSYNSGNINGITMSMAQNYVR